MSAQDRVAREIASKIWAHVQPLCPSGSKNTQKLFIAVLAEYVGDRDDELVTKPKAADLRVWLNIVKAGNRLDHHMTQLQKRSNYRSQVRGIRRLLSAVPNSDWIKNFVPTYLPGGVVPDAGQISEPDEYVRTIMLSWIRVVGCDPNFLLRDRPRGRGSHSARYRLFNWLCELWDETAEAEQSTGTERGWKAFHGLLMSLNQHLPAKPVDLKIQWPVKSQTAQSKTRFLAAIRPKRKVELTPLKMTEMYAACTMVRHQELRPSLFKNGIT